MTPTERYRYLLVYDTAYPDDGVREWPEPEQIETAEAVRDVLLSDSVDLAAGSLVDWGYCLDAEDQYAACREMALLLRTTAAELDAATPTTTLPLSTAPAESAPTWPAVRRGIVSDLTAELERSKTARDLWAALFPDMVTDPERARRESRVTALEWAVEAAGAWHPGVRRG